MGEVAAGSVLAPLPLLRAAMGGTFFCGYRFGCESNLTLFHTCAVEFAKFGNAHLRFFEMRIVSSPFCMFRMAEEEAGDVVVDVDVDNMQMLWNVLTEVRVNSLPAFSKPAANNADMYRVLVGERNPSTVHRALHELLRGRAGQPLTMSWVLYAMLRERCARDDVDMQALLDGDQRNGKGRKRHTGMFNTGSNKKSREAAADAGDDNTAPVFRILDRCLERPPSRLTDQP